MKKELRTLILNAVNATVDWVARPQGAAYPGVVLTTISNNSGLTFDGADDMSSTRVQVDIYAKEYGEAEGIARQIQTTLEGYRGGAILGAVYQGERDSREIGEDSKPFRISQDYEVHWAG